MLLSDCDTRPLTITVVQGCFLADKWHLEKWHKVPEPTKGRITHRDTQEHSHTRTYCWMRTGRGLLGRWPLGTHPWQQWARLQVTQVLLATKVNKGFGWGWWPLYPAGHWHWDTFSLTSESIWQSSAHWDQAVLAANYRDKTEATGLELNCACTHTCANKVTQAGSAYTWGD